MLWDAYRKLFGTPTPSASSSSSSNASTGAAQRRHARVQPLPRKPVEVQIMGDGFLETAHARDISVGGLAIYLPHGLNEDAFGKNVALIIKLPGGKPFEGRGIVRHASKSQDGKFVGIEFTVLDARARSALEEYVKSRLATP